MAINVGCCVAEFFAMAIFVSVCCGAATGVAGKPGWVQQVSLTFGMCIYVLATTFEKYGLQCNCAVTFALAIAKFLGIGDMSLAQAGANVASQMLGSLVGASILAVIKEYDSDLTKTLASNTLADDIGAGEAFVGEVLGTFVLVFLVFQTVFAEKPESSVRLAALPISMAVYLAHSLLIPVDGCSINPTRTFGPAVIASIRLSGLDNTDDLKDKIWEHMWVFWLGPLCGAALAVGVHVMLARGVDRGLSPPQPRTPQIDDGAHMSGRASKVGRASNHEPSGTHDTE
jgi:glycerol uptake facilitator-like aquaporin